MLGAEPPTDFLGDMEAGESQKPADAETEAVQECAASSGSFKHLGFVLHMSTEHVYVGKICSLMRLVFPTISQNTSLVALLPSYINTLGKKMDLAHDAQVPRLHRHAFAFETHQGSRQTFTNLVSSTSKERLGSASSSRASSFFVCSQHVTCGRFLLRTRSWVLRIATSMRGTVEKMNAIYNQMTALQAEVISGEKKERPGIGQAREQQSYPGTTHGTFPT